MNKSSFVHTNDPINRKIRLTVTGMVEKFVTISPKSVRLSGFIGSNLNTKVSIVFEKKYPFEILKTYAAKGENIKFKLDRLKAVDSDGQEKKGYILSVQNLKKDKGRYFDTITCETDSKIRPKIRINVHGNILAHKTVDKKDIKKTIDFYEQNSSCHI